MSTRREPIVGEDFVAPTPLVTRDFILEPLGPQHNESDYAAWTSSMEHILATPGFADWGWPVPMPIEENLSDLVKHANDFAEGIGFTYTVLSPVDGSVIGCLYMYGAKREGYDLSVRSWVRADHAELDVVLYDAVLAWIDAEWPFTAPDYAPRR